jgi:hypothetical protein
MMADAVDPLFKHIYVFVGAVAAGYYTKNSPTSLGKIKSLFPHWHEHWHVRADFVFGVVISTVIAEILYGPQDPLKAILAGLSSVAVIKQLIKGTR